MIGTLLFILVIVGVTGFFYMSYTNQAIAKCNRETTSMTTDNIATDILFDTNVASMPAGTVTTETILAIDCCE